jgi:parallel beta-helix repeat protein
VVLLALVAPLSLPPASAATTTYYVANDGNDTNDGTSEATPWQTIEKVNSSVESGATVLFKRGDVFRGQVSLDGTKTDVTFGAYGTGEAPLIAGSVEIGSWTPYNEHIWVANLAHIPHVVEHGIAHLFVNGELVRIARYPNVDDPNKGWLKVDEGLSKNSFSDAALTQPAGYFDGATLRIRTYSWLFRQSVVTSYTPGVVTLADEIGSFIPEWGYYFDNLFAFLDHENEWYYDAANQLVYLWPPDNADPNTLLVEGATYEIGIRVFWHEDNVTIENLAFRHQTEYGVDVNSSEYAVVRNNTFSYCQNAGVHTWNAGNILISGNTFDDMLNLAIAPSAANDYDVGTSIIEKNTITNTGMVPGYGKPTGGYYEAIKINGSGFTIRKNTIEYTGYCGIDLIGGSHNNIVENNVVRKSLMLLDDGAGIIVYSNNNQIRGNIVLESYGNRDESDGLASPTSGHHRVMGMGISTAGGTSGNVIAGNTVANNRDWGIRINKSSNTTIQNNVLYNNRQQMVLEGDGTTAYNNTVSGNTFLSLAPDQIGIVISDENAFGTFDHNTYCNPYSEVVLKREGRYYALAHWQHEFPTHDQNSQGCEVRLSEYTVSNPGANMLENSSFDTDVAGWNDSGDATITHDPAHPDMDGGSLKMAYEGDGNANVIPNSFSLLENQYYRLRFRVVASGYGNIQLRTNRTAPEYAILLERYFAFDQHPRDYEYVFQSPETTDAGKHLFITKAYDASTYWLDNVTFEPVEAVKNDGTQQAVLFVNPTDETTTIPLEAGTIYTDLNNEQIGDTPTLPPYGATVLIPSLTISPTIVNFGPQTITTTSLPHSITIWNHSNSPQTLASIALEGEGENFVQEHDCPTAPEALAAGASCTINVTFAPTERGTAHGTLSIATGTGPDASAFVVDLRGKGVWPLTFDRSLLDFPSQEVATRSPTHTITLSNTSESPLTINSISLQGNEREDFQYDTDCPTDPETLAVGAHCTINVVFVPQQAGPRSSTLQIVSVVGETTTTDDIRLQGGFLKAYLPLVLR